MNTKLVIKIFKVTHKSLFCLFILTLFCLLIKTELLTRALLFGQNKSRQIITKSADSDHLSRNQWSDNNWTLGVRENTIKERINDPKEVSFYHTARIFVQKIHVISNHNRISTDLLQLEEIFLTRCEIRLTYSHSNLVVYTLFLIPFFCIWLLWRDVTLICIFDNALPLLPWKL